MCFLLTGILILWIQDEPITSDTVLPEEDGRWYQSPKKPHIHFGSADIGVRSRAALIWGKEKRNITLGECNYPDRHLEVAEYPILGVKEGQGILNDDLGLGPGNYLL